MKGTDLNNSSVFHLIKIFTGIVVIIGGMMHSNEDTRWLALLLGPNPTE